MSETRSVVGVVFLASRARRLLLSPRSLSPSLFISRPLRSLVDLVSSSALLADLLLRLELVRLFASSVASCPEGRAGDFATLPCLLIDVLKSVKSAGEDTGLELPEEVPLA